MQEIIIDFDEQGNPTIEGKGFTGDDCRITKELEEAMGDTVEVTLKPEYRQPRTLGRKVGA